MKYFKERRRIRRPQTAPPTSPAMLSAQRPCALEGDTPGGRPPKVGADTSRKKDILTIVNDAHAQTTLETIIGTRGDRSRERCRDHLLRARRRRDIRLSRKEVSCLQLLVQNVLNEHLALSRELQAAHERMGLPREPIESFSHGDLTPLARNVGRLQSALERDAARLTAALRDRDERLERAMADADALRSELETWRTIYADESGKYKADLEDALAERDLALEDAATKDETIGNLRSELANLESARSTEALSMRHAITEKEVYISTLEAQARDSLAEITELRQLQERTIARLESETAARISTGRDLEVAENKLKRVMDEHQCTAIMLSKIISDKEAEVDDLGKQVEEVQSQREHEITKIKREADAKVAEIKHNNERAVAQKMVEIHEINSTLNEKQEQLRRLKSELDCVRHKTTVLHEELETARAEIATTTETAASATRRVAELDSELAEERLRHEREMQARISTLEAQLKAVRKDAAVKQEELQELVERINEAAGESCKLRNQLGEAQSKLEQAEDTIATRIPSLESDLKKARDEIILWKEKDIERNTDLATARREAKQLSKEVERLKEELNRVKLKSAEELEDSRKKKEEEASHFRKALHEKDLEIRERQDRINKLQEEEKNLNKSLLSAQKALNESGQKHRNALQNTKSSHREAEKQLKTAISKKTEEIKRLEEQIKNLQTKLQEQKSQHSQEIEKLNSKLKSAENARSTFEKKLREKEASLEGSEIERDRLLQELSNNLESHETSIKQIQNKLERVVSDLESERYLSFSLKAALVQAQAETRLTLDTVDNFETTMAAIYADAVRGKTELRHSKLKITQLTEDLETISSVANKEIEKQKSYCKRLKVRFVKYIKLREDELQAAGDSAQQNRAESKHYLDQLQSSKVELESTSARCGVLQKELDAALQEIQDLSEQTQQSKGLLAAAKAEVKSLKKNQDQQNSLLAELRTSLIRKETEIQSLSADIAKERSNVALLTQREAESLEQIDQDRKLLAQAEADVKDLKDNLERQEKHLNDLKMVLEKKESDLEVLNADLRKQQLTSADLTEKQSELKQLVEEKKKAIALKETEILCLSDDFERRSSKTMLEYRTMIAQKDSELEQLRSDLSRERISSALLTERESELTCQIDESKKLLGHTEAEVRSLRSDLELRNSSIVELRTILAERQSTLETVSTDLSKERFNLSVQMSECEDALSLIANSSKEWESGCLAFDPSLGLTSKISLLLQTIHNLQKELHDANLHSDRTNEEKADLRQDLTSKEEKLIELTLSHDQLKTELFGKNDAISELENELKSLRARLSKQRSHITEIEEELVDCKKTANVTLKAKESMIQELENSKAHANSNLERLKALLSHEKGVAEELEQELNLALSQGESCKTELDEKTESIQQLSETLQIIETRLQTQEELVAKTIQEHEDEANNFRNLLVERDKEVSILRNLLERAHQECERERKTHVASQSADGDGKKDTDSDRLKNLTAALAERDADMAKLQSVIADLQSQFFSNKTSADSEIAEYRAKVVELTKETSELRSKLEVQNCGPGMESGGDPVKLGLHSTAEQTMLIGRKDEWKHSPRRRPGAPLKRTASEGNGPRDYEHELSDFRVFAGTSQLPWTPCGRSCAGAES